MSTNNFFRTFNSITPYPPGDAVVAYSYITKGAPIGCGSTPVFPKLTSAQNACSSSNTNSCSTRFYISYPSGSLQSGSSKVYSDEAGTTLAYPTGGDGWFHITESQVYSTPVGGNIGFACRIETGSIIADLINCDRYYYNTASLSKRVATSTLACADTVVSHSVFYAGALTASTSNVNDASFLYTKSAGELVEFKGVDGIGTSPGYLKVITTSEFPQNQYGGNSHALYWNLVGGTATVYSFVQCGNGATKIKSSANSVFSGVCLLTMPNLLFSSTGAYPGVNSVVYTSSIGNSYANAGYYKISGSALDFYWIKVTANGVVHSTGTCGPTP
tara:strand:+ start:1155 stop:2144 length:990 start_codon:yes stop_codon:yes gene_type:complete